MTDCNNCKHETECNYTERYDYKYDGIVDYQNNNEYNSFKDISDLLNEQDNRIEQLDAEATAKSDEIYVLNERIKELETENKELKEVLTKIVFDGENVEIMNGGDVE